MSQEEKKVGFDYQPPPGVESEVPGQQTLREAEVQRTEDGVIGKDEKTGILIKEEQPTLTPVITITKKEYSYTKGPNIDLKLQKVTVDEDIAWSFRHLVKREVLPGKSVTTQEPYSLMHQYENPLYSAIFDAVPQTQPLRDPSSIEENGGEDINNNEQKRPKSRIPLKFKMAVDKIKKDGSEKEARKENEIGNVPTPTKRRSSIPKLTRTPSYKADQRKTSVSEESHSDNQANQHNKNQAKNKDNENINVLNDIRDKLNESETKRHDNQESLGTKNDVQIKNIEIEKDITVDKGDNEEGFKSIENFDEIYEEIINNSNEPVDDKILEVEAKVDDIEKVESKFEEIIHDYEENKNQPIVITAPLVKQRSLHEIKLPKKFHRRFSLKDFDVDKSDDVKTKRGETEINKQSKLPVRIKKVDHGEPNMKLSKVNKDSNSVKNEEDPLVQDKPNVAKEENILEKETGLSKNDEIPKILSNDTPTEAKTGKPRRQSLDKDTLTESTRDKPRRRSSVKDETVEIKKADQRRRSSTKDIPIQLKQDKMSPMSKNTKSNHIQKPERQKPLRSISVEMENEKRRRKSYSKDESTDVKRDLLRSISTVENTLPELTTYQKTPAEQLIRTKDETSIEVKPRDTNTENKEIKLNNDILSSTALVRNLQKSPTPQPRETQNIVATPKDSIPSNSLEKVSNVGIPEKVLSINVTNGKTQNIDKPLAVTRNKDKGSGTLDHESKRTEEVPIKNRHIPLPRQRNVASKIAIFSQNKNEEFVKPKASPRLLRPKKFESIVQSNENTVYKEAVHPEIIDVSKNLARIDVETKTQVTNNNINDFTSRDVNIVDKEINANDQITNKANQGNTTSIATESKPNLRNDSANYIKNSADALPLESETTNNEKIDSPADELQKKISESNVNGKKSDKNEKEPTVKGKVNRNISRLGSQEEQDKQNNKSKEDVPTRRSVFNKIAMFERQTSAEMRKPKIVDEVFKPTIANKLSIGDQTTVAKDTNQKNNVKIPKDDNNDVFLKPKAYKNESVILVDEHTVEYQAQVIDLSEQDLVAEENKVNTAANTEFNGKHSPEFKSDFESRNYSQSKKIQNTKQIDDFRDLNEELGENDSSKNVLLTQAINNELRNTEHEITKEISFQETSQQSKRQDDLSKEILTQDTNDNLSEQEFESVPNEKLKEFSGKEWKLLSKRRNSAKRGKEVEIRKINAEERVRRMQNRQEFRRSKSLADLEVGDLVRGRVTEMVVRINSREELNVGEKKEVIRAKERPRVKSVSEKIALFEGKITTTMPPETLPSPAPVSPPPTASPPLSEEEYQKRREALSTAKITYGTKDMVYMTLANRAKMPVLHLGTALLDPELTPHIVAAAIDLGYRGIDAAFIYGNEKAVGAGIRAKIHDGTVKREDLFITNKLWSTFHRPDVVETACRDSLQLMGLEYFDLYLIHNPMSFKEGGDVIPKIANVIQYSKFDFMDAWYAMERLVNLGLVRNIGVSNFNAQQIAKVVDKAKIKPVVNQVECHPYLSQERLTHFCMERNVALMCFGVLGSKGTPTELKGTNVSAIDDPLVTVMAAGLGISKAQLLVRYQIESNHAVVVKSSSPAHLWDTLKALDVTLTDAEVDALNALNKNRRAYDFRGMGDTHKNYPFRAPF